MTPMCSSSTCAVGCTMPVLAVEAGCDLVVAQGTEAGGHTGRVATLPLVPQIVDAVGDRVPVVAAGGIVDGLDRLFLFLYPLPASSPPPKPGCRSAITMPCCPWTRARPRSGSVLTAASRCGSIANERTAYFDRHPDELVAIRSRCSSRSPRGVLHLPTGPGRPRCRPDPRVLPERAGRRRHRRTGAGRRVGRSVDGRS